MRVCFIIEAVLTGITLRETERVIIKRDEVRVSEKGDRPCCKGFGLLQL